MENIFKDVKFGDKFVTRDGSCALFLEGSPYSQTVMLWVEDAGECYYYIDGTSGERIELDIMGRWEETKKTKNNENTN